MAKVQRSTIFQYCKWDPQCEDIQVLCPFAIVLDQTEWNQLCEAATQLAAEVLAAEDEILTRPELLKPLGLPRVIRHLLRGHQRSPVRSGPRVMRFDFHWTTEGWRISEANTDVPGGYIESSGFTRLMCEQFAGSTMAGDPAAQLADALARELPPAGTVALVHATAYTDDRQVMIYLAKQLRERGIEPLLVSPGDLWWTDDRAFTKHDERTRSIDGILRFYPAEWLPQLARRTGWSHFFCGSATPQCNPARALISQSKRFPLVWGHLRTAMSAWRQWLPETHDPRDVRWRHDESWVLKTAFGRVGDGIALHGVTPAQEHAKIARWARWWPFEWAAQRRFDALPLATPDGPQYTAIGVYTIDGRPAGIYGRIAARPLIDHRARDVAVLVEQLKTTPIDQIHPEWGYESRAIV